MFLNDIIDYLKKILKNDITFLNFPDLCIDNKCW